MPLPLGGTYDYRIPPGMALSEGDFVQVPFGSRQVAGVVWGPGSDVVGEDRLKDVLDRYDVPPLPPESRRFVHWVSAYTVHSLGSVLRMVMSIPEALQPPKPALAYALLHPPDDDIRLTPARRRVLDVLAEGPPRPAAELAREAGVGPSVIKALADAGLIAAVARRPHPPPPPDWRRPGPALSPAQTRAAQELRRAVGAGFAVTTVPAGSSRARSGRRWRRRGATAMQPRARSAPRFVRCQRSDRRWNGSGRC